ncbi:hypothetical protein Aave_0888 [Paracidovorax citrulli AAC00-1]|uniref:Uncharacterized protein n=1 Tax=Paracidovorax citrulli (strain AAC00-1) TaxID=397945 RepID=A1TKJ8_PARC0|nr:hypothetical protein Aave_0888 [Paracidovorax citrulli AAC00-1]
MNMPMVEVIHESLLICCFRRGRQREDFASRLRLLGTQAEQRRLGVGWQPLLECWKHIPAVLSNPGRIGSQRIDDKDRKTPADSADIHGDRMVFITGQYRNGPLARLRGAISQPLTKILRRLQQRQR